ncbi:MAG: nicotinate-nucleotide adenylyltransferase [Erysipelotrichaceae bacterium]|nr:nicotinate-nucleotide adenylyltransferase [Erysipelotrichaceae bacterium]
MSTIGKRIGLMGGSFDPIHFGHLVLAEEMRTRLSLDKVLFIPVGQAPHKASGKMSDRKRRYEMVLLATLDHPYFEVSSIEVEQSGTTYSVDTVEKIVSGASPEDRFFFIAGGDAMMELESWRSFEKLLQMVTFVGATRPGTDHSALKDKLEALRSRYSADIRLIELPELDISSKNIRERVGTGLSIKYLLPESVALYIVKSRLYAKGSDYVQK